MANLDFYYQVLGLKSGGSEEEIRQAYKDLVNVWHPDRFSHNPRLQTKAQEKLKEINEAYRVLLSSLSAIHAEKPQHEMQELSELFPKKQNDKYAYVNIKGETVIKPQFDLATEFFEGLAAVNNNGNWGYIDKTGKMVINPQFDFAAKFSEGLAAVMNGGQWGYINNTGKLVIDIKCDFALPFSKGLAIVEIGNKWGCIDKIGQYKNDLGFPNETRLPPNESTIEAIDRMDEKEFLAFIEALFIRTGTKVERGKDYRPDLVLYGEEETSHKCIRLLARTIPSINLVHAKAVEEILEVKDEYNADGLILITNNYYSEKAIAFAKHNDIQLWDKDQLMDFYRKVLNK
jgi:hypothetical protein